METYHSPLDLVRRRLAEGPVACARPDRLAVAARWFQGNFSGETLYAVKANPSPWVIDGLYEAIALSPEEAPAFFKDFLNTGLKGVNLTIPHKEMVMGFLDEVDEAAKKIGAVNTVWIDDGKLCLKVSVDLDGK